MRLRLKELVVDFKGGREHIPFGPVTYFYGKMGAGKSSIARLIDFCLGGHLEMTPALQTEFVGAMLIIIVGDREVQLHRPRGANLIEAAWEADGQSFVVSVPARKPADEVLPKSGVQVLSDLLFHLSGHRPPRVRRSKLREDSELERLSFRDLWWYCYLDQETIDSTFFHLDPEADTFKRLKSRDVLRLVLGFHQERVAELEVRLEETRQRRHALQAGAESLRAALDSARVSTELDIQSRMNELEATEAELNKSIAAIRANLRTEREHAATEAARRAMEAAAAVEATEREIADLRELIASDDAHLNELKTLAAKFRRTESARAVLGGVEFEACPRCSRPLPGRPPACCRLCGQEEGLLPDKTLDMGKLEADLKARQDELRDAISRSRIQLLKLEKQLIELRHRRHQADEELELVRREYDSRYLSQALSLERRLARVQEERSQLARLVLLPRQVNEQLTAAASLATEEAELRGELQKARQAAERDTGNVRRLESLFLDCLVRSRVPGFSTDDRVFIKPQSLLPEVFTPGEEDLVTTSFSNLGSGGKKTLFKCCFAVALHRLARERNALLPTILIIDSPMKNISERENREQFTGFYQMLYELSVNELQQTQFVLIDKEFCGPRGNEPTVLSRHMTPEGDDGDPLIRYYRA